MLSLTFIHSDVLHKWPTIHKLLHKLARLSSINYSTSDSNVVIARKNTKTPFTDQCHVFFKGEIDIYIYVISFHSSMYSFRCFCIVKLFRLSFIFCHFSIDAFMLSTMTKHVMKYFKTSSNSSFLFYKQKHNNIIVISVLGYDTNADLRRLHV